MRRKALDTIFNYYVWLAVLPVGVNAWLGVSSVLAHKFAQGKILFLGAGICAAICGMGMFSRWKVANEISEIERVMLAHRNEARRIAEEAVRQADAGSLEAHDKARAVLERVVTLLNARNEGGCVSFTARSGDVFLLDIHNICRRSANNPGHWDASTCYQMFETVLAAEKIATAMLLLNDDPRLFDFWRWNQGHTTTRVMPGPWNWGQ